MGAEAWCGEIVGALGGNVLEGATPELAKGEILGDGQNTFPIKLKDEALQKSIQFLVKIGVFPDKDDDSEDEMVFGDDDFPCDAEEPAAPEGDATLLEVVLEDMNVPVDPTAEETKGGSGAV